MGFLKLNDSEKRELEYEIIHNDARLQLTRLLRHSVAAEEPETRLALQNKAVNIARNALGMSIYVLECDTWGDFNLGEYTFHNGDIEIAMVRPPTTVLVETLVDMIQEGVFPIGSVNEILEDANLSFRFSSSGSLESRNYTVQVDILPVADIEPIMDSDSHPNIRLLIDRMNRMLADGDASGVLHASASVFETLAKDVCTIPSLEDQSLGGFFDRYRIDSKLPAAILDYILSIFRRRNIEPCAGHGRLDPPEIEMPEAIILSEMTKAFVQIEYSLLISRSEPETGTAE